MTTVDHTDWISLLARVFDELPALPGAACAGQPHLFDPPGDRETLDAARDRHESAAAVCRGCPVLARCRAWVDSAPPRRRPSGVVAGRVLVAADRIRPGVSA